MPHVDLLIYAAHAAFWAAFGVTRRLTKSKVTAPAGTGTAEEAAVQEFTAPFSRTVLAIHSLAFAMMYFGLGAAVIPDRVPQAFAAQRFVGAIVIAAGGVLCCWAVAFFSSWRYRAKLDRGHRLATGGPFQFLRHPIYMGLNFLALGSAVWVPTVFTWFAFLLMIVGSELRARSEEVVLLQAFGSEYADYCANTRRFIPGIY